MGRVVVVVVAAHGTVSGDEPIGALGGGGPPQPRRWAEPESPIGDGGGKLA